MAKLDYAVLAEYARIDAGGLVTIVGGSFDRVQAPTAGGVQQMYVALRVLLGEGDGDVPFDVKVIAPAGQYEIGLSGVAGRGDGAEPTDGFHAFVAAVGVGAPLPVAGRYVVQILLQGEVVRELPFVVSTAR